MGEKGCYNCKYYSEDMHDNSCECDKAIDLTEEEWEKHFGNDEPGCRCWSEK